MNSPVIDNKVFSLLSDESKVAVNDFIDFLYHKENQKETIRAIKEALSGKTEGSFNSVDELMADLYEDD